MRIRAATPDDAAALAAIYAPYVTGSHISFETEAPDAAEMRARIEAAGDLHPWLIAVDEAGETLGYAYAAPFRTRAAYRYAVETTVYVRRDAHGRGLGGRLYEPLLATLEAQGFTQAVAAVACPTRRACGCTNGSDSPGPAPTARSAGSSAAGGTSASGSGRWHRRRRHRRSRGG